MANTENPLSQVMLLTGCASGIGQHLANVLAASGHRLLVTDIDRDKLQTHAEKMRWQPDQVLVQKLDVRDPNAWQTAVMQTIEKWGRLDVLMNIAGYLLPAYVEAITPAMIDMHIDVNVKGVMYGTYAAAPQMIQQRGGHIINFSSLAGLAPIPGIGIYSASKFAVRGFSLIAGDELKKYNIAVTTIYPDAVQTPMLDLQAGYEEAALTFSGFRYLTVADIERTVLHVLKKKPLEISIPRYRGWMAKIGGILPALGFLIEPLLARQGRAKQQRFPKH